VLVTRLEAANAHATRHGPEAEIAFLLLLHAAQLHLRTTRNAADAAEDPDGPRESAAAVAAA
jgi:hypothetical protein